MSGLSCPDCGAWFPPDDFEGYEIHRRAVHAAAIRTGTPTQEGK